MATTTVKMELDVPEGVTILGCEHHQEGLAFEIDWPWPDQVTCEKCDHVHESRIELKSDFRVVRDLDIWGKPSFWVYQTPFDRCVNCGHRQEIIPPFRRKRAIYTFRFEEMVIRMSIGATMEDVSRRLGVSAEMVEQILNNWANEQKQIDKDRVITDIGIDEISLKKGHKMYVTILTDLTDPKQPRVLAVAEGRDEKAAADCLRKLSDKQRAQVRTHRTDMCKAYPSACGCWLPNSQHVADRFHVAKRLGEVVDDVRKKNHASV